METVMSDSRKYRLARAAGIALEPIVEIFLELGVTSPEAESLLRSVFVHKAREQLSKHGKLGKVPSDVRVALLTGVHRNFVKNILAGPPGIAKIRQEKKDSTTKLLHAWRSSPQYLDDRGKPRDLPESGAEPSFASLVKACMPGTAPSVALEVLESAGLIETLRGRSLRLRKRFIGPSKLRSASVAEMGRLAKDLLETLRHNVREPYARRVCEGLKPIDVDVNSLPRLRERIKDRSRAFLAAISSELISEARQAQRARGQRRAKVGLAVLEIEHE